MNSELFGHVWSKFKIKIDLAVYGKPIEGRGIDAASCTG